MRRHDVPASTIFDAAVHPGREDELAALGLEVVAGPGMPAPDTADPDLLAIRRGLGEGRLAVMSAVERLVESRGVLEAEGVPCEGCGDGIFGEVDGGSIGRRGLRITGPDGLVARDTLLVRHVRASRPPREPVFTEAVEPSPGAMPAAPPPPAPPSAPAPAPAHQAEDAAEATDGPIAAPRTPLAMTGTVGRGGRNMSADVRAIQDRLVELRALDTADAATERPTAAAPVADATLPRTIEAIEAFQRHLDLTVTGAIEPNSPTRTELDRAIALPSPGDFEAIAGELSALGLTTMRGLTITGPVGAAATGNAVDDVRAVQRRLVDAGALAASHRESPAAGATGTIAQSRLTATIAALRTFQNDVRFFVAKGSISGAVTPGVVAPGDATAALLDRLSVYTLGSGTSRIAFRDHIVSGSTRADTGVMFRGTAAPSALPAAAFTILGPPATPAEAAAAASALRFVSTHEGNFDAINTYDRALVSTGFIQFAGGRGLPRYLALIKVRQPAKFRDLLQKFGIDVEFTVSAGAIDTSRVVVLDPSATRVLRATAAETAIRDDKRLTAALVVSGRDRDVQAVQIEAAFRDYVRPALTAAVSWAAGRRAPLGAILRSQKGMAALIDRTIQEGLGAARRRFERIIQRLVRAAAPPPPGTAAPPPPTLRDLQSREGDVLAELERDLQAAVDVATTLARGRTALDALVAAASAAGATVGGVMARTELADARRAVASARSGLPGIVNVSAARGATVDATLAAMNTTLTAEVARLALTPEPPSVAALTTALTASRQALATAAAPVSTASMFLARVQSIRRSSLDAGLAEVA